MPAYKRLLDNGSAITPRETVNFVGATFSDNASDNRTDITVGTAALAGAGLTHTSGVLAVGAGNGISVAADSVAIASTVAGAGLTHTSGVLDVGAGTGVSVAADSVSIAEGYLRQQSTVLTNAQVLALRAAPITCVTAPGAGKIAEFVSAALIFNRTAAYTESTDNLAFKYVDGSGTQCSHSIEATGFVDASGDAITFASPVSGTTLTNPIITAAGALSNGAIVLHNIGDGEYGGGDAANTLTVIVTYRIHTTTL